MERGKLERRVEELMSRLDVSETAVSQSSAEAVKRSEQHEEELGSLQLRLDECAGREAVLQARVDELEKARNEEAGNDTAHRLETELAAEKLITAELQQCSEAAEIERQRLERRVEELISRLGVSETALEQSNAEADKRTEQHEEELGSL